MKIGKITKLITENFKSIPSIQAILLGGSYSFGIQKKNSDVDILLLYRDKLNTHQIKSTLKKIGDFKNPLVTKEWEQGVLANGRARFVYKKTIVELHYWHIPTIIKHIEKTTQFIYGDLHQFVPFGFYSYFIYGYIYYAKKLYDPNGILRKLQKRAGKKTKAVQKNIVAYFFNEAWALYTKLVKSALRGNKINNLLIMTRLYFCIKRGLFGAESAYYVFDKASLVEVKQKKIISDEKFKHLKILEKHLVKKYSVSKFLSVAHKSILLLGTYCKVDPSKVENAIIKH